MLISCNNNERDLNETHLRSNIDTLTKIHKMHKMQYFNLYNIVMNTHLYYMHEICEFD